jgi:hypothetical protein
MTLHGLLRNVASDLRRDNGGDQLDTDWEFCHVGYEMCQDCPVERNRKRCPLTDDRFLHRWAAMQLRQISNDPIRWASEARRQITQESNPALFVLFEGSYQVTIEGGDDAAWWRDRLEQVLAAWNDKDWLRRYAHEAQRRHLDSPQNQDYRDVFETLDSIMALKEGKAIIGEVPIQ